MSHEQYRAHAEQQGAHWWFVARRMVLAIIAEELLAGKKNALVVDLGCGSGANAAAFAQDHRYIGVDPEGDAVKWAQQSHTRVDFLCGTVGDSHVDEKLVAADLVLLTDVLEHVEDARRLLASVVGTIQPGCRVVITVPADMRLWSEHDVNLGHYRRYDRESFETLWSGLPLRDLLVSHFNSRLYWPIRAVRGLNRWRGTALGDSGTDLVIPPRVVNSWLTRVFSGEAQRMLSILRGKRADGYARGVSLIAILQRKPCDHHSPTTCSIKTQGSISLTKPAANMGEPEAGL